MHRTIYPIEDLEYIGFDQLRGDWVVNEQLYPESRGWLVHGFKIQADAERFAATGIWPDAVCARR
jgi:hypothetical protein